jgi:membrane protein required for colicin V production
MDFAMTDFNYFDVTIAAVVVLLGIKGFMQGFIKEAFGLAGLIGGVYFGSRLSEKAATFIDTNFFHLENASLLKLLGFMAILTIIWVGATLLGSIFSKLTSASGLGFLNRLFGFILGGGKYFIIFALIITALSNVKLVQEKLGKYTEHSILYPYLHEAGSYLINLDPSTLGFNLDTKKETPAVATEASVAPETNSSIPENNITAP